MRRRTFALATAAAAAGLSLPACGGTREAERGPNDEIIVTFWHSMRGNNGEQMTAFVDEFNENQSEIIVRESEQGMYDEAYTKLMQVVGTDEAPDIMQMGKLRETLDARMITPMQEFVEADGDFDVDTLLPAVRAEYTVEDALQFMPQAASNNVIFFNVDAFEEAGLDPSDPPRTYSEFRKVAETLKEELGMDEGAAFLIEGGMFSALLSAQGEPLLNNANGWEGAPTAAEFDGAAGVDVMTWLKDMFDAGLLGNYGRDFDDMRQPWYSKKVGMIMDTTAATIMHEQAATFAFDVMPIPVPDGVEPLTASPGGAGLAILEDVADETKQAAFELVKFLVSPEIQARWAANTGYFPVTDPAWDEETLIQAMDEIPAMETAYTLVREAGDSPDTRGALSGVSPYEYLPDAWEAVYDGGDPGAELEKAAELVNADLKKYNEAN
ncbi:MAG TPA: ABC transporter substrate-binding protein [Candidatus Brachybacterium merdavium]|uniref:ABC transporter substrate-binding protein n=1 Tax=Candidatus Brachybacterium merdavium TaxID=2838513 RepID=A0A9D2LCF2_9MICO|nr:ABC transporter substrate-binding protein [Candidatus Brachybacterium merdavium]